MCVCVCVCVRESVLPDPAVLEVISTGLVEQVREVNLCETS